MRAWRCVVCWAGISLVASVSHPVYAWDFGLGRAPRGDTPSLFHNIQASSGESGSIGASNQPGTVLTPAAIPSLGTDDILVRLKAMNISYSVQEADLREWLANPDYTPYPAIAWGLIDLLQGKRLMNAVDLDVIVFNYERVSGTNTPRKIEDIDQATMIGAVLKGFNSRYGARATDISEITK